MLLSNDHLLSHLSRLLKLQCATTVSFHLDTVYTEVPAQPHIPRYGLLIFTVHANARPAAITMDWVYTKGRASVMSTTGSSSLGGGRARSGYPTSLASTNTGRLTDAVPGSQLTSVVDCIWPRLIITIVRPTNGWALKASERANTVRR